MAKILAIGNSNGDVGLVDLNTGNMLSRVNLGQMVRSVKISASGRELYAAAGNILVKRATENLSKFAELWFPITDFCANWGPDLIYTCSDRTVLLWDARAAAHSPSQKFESSYDLTCMDVRLQRDLLFTGGTNGSVTSWNIVAGKAESNAQLSRSRCISIAACTNGSWIGVGNSAGQFYDFSCENQKLVWKHTAHCSYNYEIVRCMFPRHQAHWFPIVAFTRRLCQYNRLTATKMGPNEFVMKEPWHPVRKSCAVSYDGSAVYSGFDNGKVMRYEFGGQRVVEIHVDFGDFPITAMDFYEVAVGEVPGGSAVNPTVIN